MSSSSSAYLTGQMLVAMPSIGDPRFDRSVILICEHDADHAMGVAVNRPVGSLTISELLQRMGMETEAAAAPDDLVLIGGPVETERGFVLHTRDKPAGVPGLPIDDDIMLTASREILRRLGEPAQKPRRAALAIGYAGWSAGQLERELREGVWLTCDADEDILFDAHHERKWERALRKLGVSATQLSGQSGRA